MKVLKNVLKGIVLLCAIFFIGAIFLSKSTKVSRSITISSDPITVYNLVANFHTWNTWSHWSKMDPSQKVSISGTDKSIGSEMSWEGKKTGIGKMTITEIEEGKSLTINMVTQKPSQGSAINNMTFVPVEGGTQFTWTFTSENSYPFGRWMGLMMTNMLGNAFENSEANVKSLLESHK